MEAMNKITPYMIRRAKPTTLMGAHRESRPGNLRVVIWPAVKFPNVREPVLISEEDGTLRQFKSGAKALAYAAKALKKRQKAAAMKESMS